MLKKWNKEVYSWYQLIWFILVLMRNLWNVLGNFACTPNTYIFWGKIIFSLFAFFLMRHYGLLFVIQLTQEIKPLSSWIAQLLDSHTHTHKKNDAIGWKKYGAPFFSITVVILMQERLLRVSFPKKCEDDVIISFFPW